MSPPPTPSSSSSGSLMRCLGSNALFFVLTLACATALNYFIKDDIQTGYANKLFTDFGINVILAVSLTMVNGFTGQFSMGHAGFMAVGGYVSAALTYYLSYRFWGAFGVHPGVGGQTLFFAACLAGGLAGALLGYLVGLPSLRLRGDYLAIVTLGFGEIVRVFLQRSGDVLYDPADLADTPLLKQFTHLGGALGFTGIPTYTTLFSTILFVGLMLFVALRLKYSSFGRAFISIREDEIAAEAMGINVAKYKVRAFVISSFFAGVAGALFAHKIGLNPRELGFQKSFDVIIMVVLGGMGSISGAVFAAGILTYLPEKLRAFEDYRMIIYAASLILIMLVRPQGLFGIHEIWELSPVRRFFSRKSAAGGAS